ncbi:helix-turn-helix transcriptional regulator [Bacillus sp. 03113]|uniref:helix-turn-helix transcriptional regulator n=1 Tax=Bacillus sp. 03113 TaxID=2578211 RepID=UPI0015E886A9|nr:helix-turn-helix transcriptional regulator [Bacillus sp. 03113]
MLRKHRKARGLTQAQLGDRIGKSKSQISDLERGRNIMRVDTAKVISIELGCDIDDLYEWAYDDPKQDLDG